MFVLLQNTSIHSPCKYFTLCNTDTLFASVVLKSVSISVSCWALAVYRNPLAMIGGCKSGSALLLTSHTIYRLQSRWPLPSSLCCCYVIVDKANTGTSSSHYECCCQSPIWNDSCQLSFNVLEDLWMDSQSGRGTHCLTIPSYWQLTAS